MQFNQSKPDLDRSGAVKQMGAPKRASIQLNMNSAAFEFGKSTSTMDTTSEFIPSGKFDDHKNDTRNSVVDFDASDIVSQSTCAKSSQMSDSSENASAASLSDSESTKDELSQRSPSPKAQSDQKPKKKSKKKAETKQESLEWKRKVKTELCKYWLAGQDCENQSKDQGCGFAHGVTELQKKKGLNKQYLTSVCKNFIQDPAKCLYGHRCIF